MSRLTQGADKNPHGAQWARGCRAPLVPPCASSLTNPVVLQALAADPPPHAKCKDKFLVQSAFIPPDEEMHSLPEMVSWPFDGPS